MSPIIGFPYRSRALSYAVIVVSVASMVHAESESKTKDSLKQEMSTVSDTASIEVPDSEEDEHTLALLNRVNGLIDLLRLGDQEDIVAFSRSLPPAISDDVVNTDIRFQKCGSKKGQKTSTLSITRHDKVRCQLHIDCEHNRVIIYTESSVTDGIFRSVSFWGNGFPKTLVTIVNGKQLGRQATWTEDGIVSIDQVLETSKPLPKIGVRPIRTEHNLTKDLYKDISGRVAEIKSSAPSAGDISKIQDVLSEIETSKITASQAGQSEFRTQRDWKLRLFLRVLDAISFKTDPEFQADKRPQMQLSNREMSQKLREATDPKTRDQLRLEWSKAAKEIGNYRLQVALRKMRNEFPQKYVAPLVNETFNIKDPEDERMLDKSLDEEIKAGQLRKWLTDEIYKEREAAVEK